MHRASAPLLFLAVLAGQICRIAYAQTTIADPQFDTSVRVPAYTSAHPVLVIGEAHHNFHTMHGRYHPLARLLVSDGYEVVPGKTAFTESSLRHVRVLIISNARGGQAAADVGKSAFLKQEGNVVEKWVGEGGSLLLIADHVPFGSAAHDLALRFGVEMGRSYVFDPKFSEGNPTFLVYSDTNGLLGDSAIIRGRSETERVHRIVAFTGQWLSVPLGATALMRLSTSAFEADTYAAGLAAIQYQGHGAGPQRTIDDRAQGVALSFGKGRVIIVGEAAMFSAQLLKSGGSDMPDLRFGMNAPGNDDRQFALNAVHWLSGTLR